jgi:hypothetical protein
MTPQTSVPQARPDVRAIRQLNRDRKLTTAQFVRLSWMAPDVGVVAETIHGDVVRRAPGASSPSTPVPARLKCGRLLADMEGATMRHSSSILQSLRQYALLAVYSLEDLDSRGELRAEDRGLLVELASWLAADRERHIGKEVVRARSLTPSLRRRSSTSPTTSSLEARRDQRWSPGQANRPRRLAP